MYEGTPIDPYNRRATVTAIDDGHFRAEWQRAMRSRHLAGFHRLPARSVLTAVHRGNAGILGRAAGFRRMVLLGEVGRRQELVRGLFSVDPSLPMVSMRGSRPDAGP